MIRYAIACAMLAAPAGAWAQTTAAQAPVTVEIVATGEVSVPAQRFRLSVTVISKGETEDAAKAKLATDKAALMQSLGQLGIREARLDTVPAGNSFMSMFAGLGGMSKPSVSMDVLTEDGDAKPQATATETLQLDAPSRAAAASGRKIVEAGAGTMSEEVIGLLDDYPAASRSAKADALAKARVQAASYGEALGLRQAAIVRISEKQDIVAGSMAFISQIVGMIAPKTGENSNSVTVRESVTVEFRLTR